MKEIKLTKGKYALVDDEDYKRVSRHKWQAHISSTGRNWYAVRTEYAPKGSGIEPDRRTIQMANFILQPPLGFEVDHIDVNGLNNQKNNLRLATRSQNCANSRSPKGRKYKGAYWSRGAWVCRIQAHGAQHYIGRFKTELEAAIAYDKKARELHGPYARTNGLG